MRLVTLLLCVLIASGCKTAVVTESVVAKNGAAGADAQLEFWHELADRPVTSNDDAFHGLLLYVDDADPSSNYDQRVASMKGKGLLPKDFSAAGNHAVTRGTLAYAMCKILNIKGGVMMHLTGGNQRYAVRELMYMGLFPTSTINQTFTGSEFLGIVGKMEDYQRGDPSNVPASVMPSEMNAPPSTQPAG